MDLLPADVLADVLGRLPPPSLAACRCVSKEWRDFVNGRDALRLTLLPAKVAGMFLFLSSTPGIEFFARPTAGPAVPRSPDYLPLPSHRVGRVSSHCNGLLAFYAGVVANPVTRQWTRLPTPPPPPGPEISPWLFHEHIVFDPTLSRHYEVFLIPVPPSVGHGSRVSFIPETAEWPPSRFSLRVFSSRTWRWEERTFLRQGESAGTVADLRLLQQDIMDALGNTHQSVYWDEALYTSCGGNFFIRMSLLSGKYQVIKPPACIELSKKNAAKLQVPFKYGEIQEGSFFNLKDTVLHLGRSKGEVCAALVHDTCRLKTWSLKESESSGQMEWVLKHEVDFGYELARCKYGNQVHGPWMLYEDDDVTWQVQEKSVHGPQGSEDVVYHGENYEEEEEESNCHHEPGEDSGSISEYEEEEDDEHCEVPLQFEWDSDNDDIMDGKDVVNMRSNHDITFLGFHPSKEVVFVHVSASRGVAYHLNGTKLQDLGGLHFSELDFVRQAFMYTPCRMTLPETQLH